MLTKVTLPYSHSVHIAHSGGVDWRRRLDGRDSIKSQGYLDLFGFIRGSKAWGQLAGRVICSYYPTNIPDTNTSGLLTRTQTDTPVIPTETPIITPTIPPSPDYTPTSLDYSPASDSESDPSEDPTFTHIPTIPSISHHFYHADETATTMIHQIHHHHLPMERL
ncbi:hypothetical protein Tco_0066220 [Tanacetum coccineum]